MWAEGVAAVKEDTEKFVRGNIGQGSIVKSERWGSGTGV